MSKTEDNHGVESAKDANGSEFEALLTEFLQKEIAKMEAADHGDGSATNGVRSLERFMDTSQAVEKFAGGSRFDSELWLKQLELAKDTGNWSDQFLKAVLLEKLIGAARVWHLNLFDAWTTWNAWKERFQKSFMPKESTCQMSERFRNSYQQRGESLEMFVTRTELLAIRLGLEQSGMKAQVLRGLAIEYAEVAPYLLLRKHEDSDELIRDIRDTTELMKSMQLGGMQRARRNFRGKVVVCYVCGEEGHFKRHCLDRNLQ